MIEVLTVNALRTIALLTAIANMVPFKRWMDVFLDSARYHHAGMVRNGWFAKACRITLLMSLPNDCPGLLSPLIRLRE